MSSRTTRAPRSSAYFATKGMLRKAIICHLKKNSKVRKDFDSLVPNCMNTITVRLNYRTFQKSYSNFPNVSSIKKCQGLDVLVLLF